MASGPYCPDPCVLLPLPPLVTAALPLPGAMPTSRQSPRVMAPLRPASVHVSAGCGSASPLSPLAAARMPPLLAGCSQGSLCHTLHGARRAQPGRERSCCNSLCCRHHSSGHSARARELPHCCLQSTWCKWPKLHGL